MGITQPSHGGSAAESGTDSPLAQVTRPRLESSRGPSPSPPQSPLPSPSMQSARSPLSLSALFLLAGAAGAQVSQSAEFELRFDATWSSATHPGAFPGGAHFSPLIGGTHDGTLHFWQAGALATNGIEVMAETGGTGALSNEVNAAILQGTAGELVLGSGIGSPASTSTGFTATQAHSRLSLVTMVAPSPDWFLGVDGVELFENGRWIDTKVIELHAWDSGTDSGTGFNSSNQDTNPAEPIHLITGGPFFGVTPLGTFTIKRTSGASYCSAKQNSAGCLPTISSVGSASATSPAPFTIHAANVINQKSGLLFYGFGDSAAPFQGGTLCVQGPFQRTTVQNSGGSAAGNDCTGNYAFDMNAWIQSGLDPSLAVGARVYAQYWYRDPLSPSQTGLSNGLDFVICP